MTKICTTYQIIHNSWEETNQYHSLVSLYQLKRWWTSHWKEITSIFSAIKTNDEME